jgi:hypothetical protein
MIFDIHIIYKSPSRECLFLGNGWGVRDVRGPYLSAPIADIIIDNWALSLKVPSTVKLTLSVSNLCEVDALFVRATGAFGSEQTLVRRNDEAVLTLVNILADPLRRHTVIVLEPSFGARGKIAATAGTIDIVAIDELRLTR